VIAPEPAPPPADAAAVVAALDRRAERRDTTYAGGRVAWRLWGAGPPLVLLHGAQGSWTHWLANVDALAARFRLLVPDLPGYGDSDLPDGVAGVEDLAAAVAAGLDALVPPPALVDVAGFSMGGIVAGVLAARPDARVRALVLLGPNGLALPGGRTRPLRRLTRDLDAAGVAAVHRENLGILMLADPARIDDLAVHVQAENVRRTRFRSTGIPESDALLRALPAIHARLVALYGEHDAFAGSGLADRRRALARFHPDLDFRVVPGAGHWTPYEAPEVVHAVFFGLLRGSDRGDGCSG